MLMRILRDFLPATLAMKPHRFTFADDTRTDVPAKEWITRATITGLIAGLGAVAYLFGYLRF